jgi:hypothetical protein
MLLNCFAENPCIYRFALVKPTVQSTLKPMADCFSAQTIRRRFLTRMKLVLVLLVAGIVSASSIFCNQILPCESVSNFFWSTRNFLLHTFRFWRRHCAQRRRCRAWRGRFPRPLSVTITGVTPLPCKGRPQQAAPPCHCHRWPLRAAWVMGNGDPQGSPCLRSSGPSWQLHEVAALKGGRRNEEEEGGNCARLRI